MVNFRKGEKEMIEYFNGYWREILISVMILVIIIQWLIIFKQNRRRKTELTPVINEVRTAMRKQHISQQRLFKEVDYLLAEIPNYVQKKVEGLIS